MRQEWGRKKEGKDDGSRLQNSLEKRLIDEQVSKQLLDDTRIVILVFYRTSNSSTLQNGEGEVGEDP